MVLFKVAQKEMKFLGYCTNKICHQELQSSFLSSKTYYLSIANYDHSMPKGNIKKVTRNVQTEKTHLQGSITIRLISCFDGEDLLKQVNMLSCYISKTAEFNQVKQDVSRKVILPLINEFSLDQTIRGFPNASNNWRQKCFVYYVPSDHRHSRHSQRIRLHGRAHLAAEVHVRARTSGSVSGRRKHFIRHRGNDDLLAGVQLESARVRARFSH